MKDFLLELADLMEKHGVTAEAVDNNVDYYPAVAGVKFEQGWSNPEMEYKTVQTKIEFGPVELRNMADV